MATSKAAMCQPSNRAQQPIDHPPQNQRNLRPAHRPRPRTFFGMVPQQRVGGQNDEQRFGNVAQALEQPADGVAQRAARLAVARQHGHQHRAGDGI